MRAHDADTRKGKQLDLESPSSSGTYLPTGSKVHDAYQVFRDSLTLNENRDHTAIIMHKEKTWTWVFRTRET